MLWQGLACVLLYLCPVWALNVTAPAAGEVVDLSKSYTVQWTTNVTDPVQVSVDLVNATINPSYVLSNIIRGANTSVGEFVINWPAVVPNETFPYQLVFLSYGSGSYVNQSGVFNLTLPAGEIRNATNNTSPINANGTPTVTSTLIATATATTTSTVTPITPAKTPASGLSGGDIAAAVVLPVAFVAGLAVAGILLFRKRRRSRAKTKTIESGPLERPELEDKTAGSRRQLSSIQDRNSAELPVANKNPIEMPAYVPVIEMASPTLSQSSAGSRKHTSGVAGSDMMVNGN